MSKLLSANFIRLKKDKFFWSGLVFMLAAGIFFPVSISRILIEQMKGTISAQYKNGKLSICIWLPDVSGD